MLRLPITRNGVVLPRWLVLLLGVLLSVMLSFSTEVPSARAETPSPSPSPSETAASAVKAADSDGDGSPDRPDLVSAALTAQALGVAVEDLSQRTQSVRVVVNPDGTSTQESFAVPVWVQDADGKWIDVDYTLVAREGGGFVPKAAPSTDTVVIDGGGAKEFARMELPGGGSTTWSWPVDLPAAKVEGPTATYAVGDGVDLVVTATSLGVSTRIRINSADAVVPEFKVKIRTDGVDLEESADGTLAFIDGKRRGDSSVLAAWDGRLDAAGDPIEVVRVDTDLVETASSGERTDQTLTLSTPDELVEDPEVVYPITIDPDIAPLTSTQDTWVRSGETTVHDLAYRIIVGRVGSSVNTNQAYSYVQWANGQLAGRQVLNADVSFFQYEAASCSDRRMNIHPVTQSWNEATMVWTSRPSYSGSTGTSSYLLTNTGGDGCGTPNGYVSADVTGMVQAWADGTAGGGLANYGIQLNVPDANKADPTYERRFCTSEYDTSHSACNSASTTPKLTMTYNAAPNKPAAPAVVRRARLRPSCGPRPPSPRSPPRRPTVKVRTSPTTLRSGPPPQQPRMSPPAPPPPWRPERAARARSRQP